MDRVLVYDGALPQTTDILQLSKNTMVGEAFQNMSILGTNTVVAGLAIAPTSPASLQVTIGTGSIYSLDAYDGVTPYGDLGLDIATGMKQAILRSPVTLTITPPGTSGYEQYYLVEVELTDLDTGSQVLSYFNAANPAAPWSGPNNAGTSNYTQRNCVVSVALKAGTAAPSGTAVVPTADAGYTGLYVIHVINGQTSITSSNWFTVQGAPFFTVLPQIPSGVQGGWWVYGVDSSVTANAITVNVTPIPTAYTPGMGLRVKVANTNTGATTINVNGLGTQAVVQATGAALVAGSLTANQVAELFYDGAHFQITNFIAAATSGGTTNNFNTVNIPYVADTGAVNAMIGTYSPAIAAYVSGLIILIKVAHTNTSTAVTINCNGLGVRNIVNSNLTAPLVGEFVAGEVLLLVYDGTQFQCMSGASGSNGTQGPQGIQGPAGSVSTALGSIGTFAFVTGGPYSTGAQYNGVSIANNASAYPASVTGGPYYSGTWQIVSSAISGYQTTYDPTFGSTSVAIYTSLAQRIA